MKKMMVILITLVLMGVAGHISVLQGGSTGTLIPSAPPLEGQQLASSVPAEQDYWVPVSNIIFDKDKKYHEKIAYIKSHNYPLYEELIKNILGKSQNGYIARDSFEYYLDIMYGSVALMPLQTIKDGQATFEGKLDLIKTNEVAYQNLLADLTAHTNDAGFILRDYAQSAVNGAYWRMKFAAWYTTAALYGGTFVTQTQNFLNTNVLPRIKSAYQSTGSWMTRKRGQVSDWYRTRGTEKTAQ